MTFYNDFPLFKFFDSQISMIFFDGEILSPSASKMNSFLKGVLGSVLVGYGVLLAFMVFYGLNKKEKWAWTGILVSLLIWYILDTGMSIFYGAMFNIIFNNVFFLLVLIPLLLIRSSVVKQVKIVI